MITKILGTAGAGKTYSIAQRLRSSGLSNSAVVTYRKNLTNDLKINVANSLQLNKDDEIINENIKTFHGLCLGLISKNLGAKQVINGKSMQEINRELGFNFGNVNKSHYTPGDSVASVYSWMINTEINKISEYPNIKNLKININNLADKIKHYKEIKERMNVIDYTDMLTLVHDNYLYPHVNTLYIDEYQDMSKFQNRMVSQMSHQIENLVIVGDPNQSIMGWAGSSPDYFNNFIADHEIVLKKTYRVGKGIWEKSRNVLRKANIKINKVESADHIGNVIDMSNKEYMSSSKMWGGDNKHTKLHIVRTNYQALLIAERMKENGIIFKGIGGWTYDEVKLYNAIKIFKTNPSLMRKNNHLIDIAKSYPAKYFSFKGTKKQLLKAIVENDMKLFVGGKIFNKIFFTKLKSNKPTTSKKINKALQINEETVKNNHVFTTIATIHGAKGMEADTVFLHTDITSKIKKSMKQDPKEEARVWFVALSRAKYNLVVVHNKSKIEYKV